MLSIRVAKLFVRTIYITIFYHLSETTTTTRVSKMLVKRFNIFLRKKNFRFSEILFHTRV